MIMDHSFVHQNSANPRRARTLPSWISAATYTSTAESTYNCENDTKPSLPVAIKTEFTEYDEDVTSVGSLPNPEPADIKPRIEDIPLHTAIKSEPADVKPKLEDIPLCSSTISEPVDIKPNVEDIPIETVFVQEGDDTEFVPEDRAAAVETADSTNVDDRMLSDNDEVLSEKTEPTKECKVEISTPPQSSSSNISAPAASSPSALPTSVPTGRRMCMYRHKCYRLATNVQHKKDCSHPGDADYDGQPECDSTSGGSPSKPRCWYGINCYRKNEEHKQKFHHSPPNSRKRNATRDLRENTNERDDSDAFDDSFIDDDPVEDFALDSEDEETEFSDFDSSSSSDDDSYPGLAKSKKKKFNIL